MNIYRVETRSHAYRAERGIRHEAWLVGLGVLVEFSPVAGNNENTGGVVSFEE